MMFYYSPETMPNIPLTVSEQKRQLVYDQLKCIIKTSEENLKKIIYGCFSVKNKCNFDLFCTMAACYDKELYIDLLSEKVMKDLSDKYNINDNVA